jgi:hypothetical protein
LDQVHRQISIGGAPAGAVRNVRLSSFADPVLNLVFRQNALRQARFARQVLADEALL